MQTTPHNTPTGNRPAPRPVVWSLVALLMVFLMTLTGCQPGQSPDLRDNPKVGTPGDNWGSGQALRLHEGQMLLEEVLGPQRDLDKITMIPFISIRPEVRALLQEITNASRQGYDFLKNDATLKNFTNFQLPEGFSPDGLPYMEVKAREGIEALTTRDILHSSGAKLEFNLLYNQLSSTRYVSQLAAQMADAVTDPGLKQKFTEMSRQFAGLYDKTFQLMTQAYKP